MYLQSEIKLQGWIQDFKLGGPRLNKLRQAEGGTNFLGVFRVKNPPLSLRSPKEML